MQNAGNSGPVQQSGGTSGRRQGNQHGQTQNVQDQMTGKAEEARIDIATLKKTTACHLCHQIEHWRRECPLNPENQLQAGQGEVVEMEQIPQTINNDKT